VSPPRRLRLSVPSAIPLTRAGIGTRCVMYPTLYVFVDVALLQDLEAPGLEDAAHGRWTIEIRVLDVDDGTALLHDVRRDGFDIVVEAQDQPAGAQRGTACIQHDLGMRHVIEHLEEADGVEFTISEEPRPHDVAHDLIPNRRRRVPDRRFAGLDAANLAVSLCQGLLEKEAVAASDLEQ